MDFQLKIINKNLSIKDKKIFKKLIIRYQPEHHNIFEEILDRKFDIQYKNHTPEKVDLYEFDLVPYGNNDGYYLGCGNLNIFYDKNDNEFCDNILNLINESIPDNNIKMKISNEFTTSINCINMKKEKILWTGDNDVEIQFPICILSLGRYNDDGTTHKILTEMGIKHYLFIEPDEQLHYINWYNPEYCELMICPENFSHRGLGSSIVRNYILDTFSNYEYTWILDDNIVNYTRLYKGFKNIIKSKEIFTSVEEYVKRYTNIGMCSHNLGNFICCHSSRVCMVVNTKCYSSCLIHTSLRFREFRYNEDLLLSVDTINNGRCTISFNHYLFNKKTSGSQTGGNHSIYNGNEKNNGYDEKYEQTVELIKHDETIPNEVIIKKKMKTKDQHLQINYKLLKNHKMKLIKNTEYISNWKTGVHM